MPDDTNMVPRSRLEVNFLRVFHETQQMASGIKTKDWTFEKLVGCRRLLVLYGSETGTAQQVAERLVREATRRHYSPLLAEMNTATVRDLLGELRLNSSAEGEAGEENLLVVLKKLVSEVTEHKKQDLVNMQTDVECTVSMQEEVPAEVGGVNEEGVSRNNEVDQCQSINEEDDLSLLEDPLFLTRFYSKLPPLAVVFVAATTGQGDDPENMKSFFQHLWSHRQNRQLLSGVRFGVLALGDSSYQKFNYSGKRVNNLLTVLGGSPLVKIGLADDQHDLGPDFVVDLWLDQFWTRMSELYPLPDGVLPIASDVLPPARFQVTFLSGDVGDTDAPIPASTARYVFDETSDCNERNPCESLITKLDRVTAVDHFQDVRLLEFDVSKIQHQHKPGDVLMVQPENLDAHVDEFLKVMNLDGSKQFFVKPVDRALGVREVPQCVLEQPCTIAQCVKKYFDIMSVPKRYFFELLSFFTTDVDEKEKFLEFSSAAGQQDLYDYCNRPKRSIVEVLADFTHTNRNIPFEYLFDLIPMMKPRAYSIASSAVMYPGRAQILMAVVNYRTILKRPRLGVCSNWLITLSIGDRVKIWMKKGTLKFPTVESFTTAPTRASEVSLPPVIMIGPGTGCAPFRAYIQERIALNTAGDSHPPLLLFFGCRSHNKDHFFKDEWSEQCSRHQLELYTAFSRDQEDKVYVQHRIRDCSERLWQLIESQRAHVFFAGNAKRVPIDVHQALTDVCTAGLNDKNRAAAYVKSNLEKRYQTETWA